MVSLLRLYFGTDCMLMNISRNNYSFHGRQSSHTSGNCDILKLKGIIETKIHDVVSELVSFMSTCTLLIDIDIDIPVSARRCPSSPMFEMPSALAPSPKSLRSSRLSLTILSSLLASVCLTRFHFWY
jgi:hypothetical protein